MQFRRCTANIDRREPDQGPGHSDGRGVHDCDLRDARRGPVVVNPDVDGENYSNSCSGVDRMDTTLKTEASHTATTPLSDGHGGVAPLSTDDLRKLDAYWRASNYLAVGQIYLL